MQRQRTVVANALRRNAATSATATRRRPPQASFPPKEIATPPTPGEPSTSTLTPELWASLQLPTEAALSAFAHRIGLGEVLDSPDRVRQVCIHPSFLPFYSQYQTSKTQTLQSNAHLSMLGNSLLGLFASEHLHVSYPHLPSRVLKAAVTAFVGPATCSSIARQMGATPLLRWRRTAPTLTKGALLYDEALASIPRSVIAALYREKSLDAARTFFAKLFLSRELDLRSLLKFRDPKMALRKTVELFKREPPKSRLLKETGRLSNSPVFVVAIYSGTDKLGEGFGSSLKMAEYRAAEDSLHRLYLTRHPPHLSQMPSQTFSPSHMDLFDPKASLLSVSFKAYPLGQSEILLGSAGKGSAVGRAGTASEQQETLD